MALRLIVGPDLRGARPRASARRPAIIASKHQSAWETLVFHALVPEIAVGLKEELTRIPVFGWYLMRAGNIRIDRGAAARAIRSLVGAPGGRWPGPVGADLPRGHAARARATRPTTSPAWRRSTPRCGLPVVPVALNSGLFWRRRGFIKRPGRIVVEFLRADPARPRPQAFMRRARERDRDRHRPAGGRGPPALATPSPGWTAGPPYKRPPRPGSSVGRAAD